MGKEIRDAWATKIKEEMDLQHIGVHPIGMGGIRSFVTRLLSEIPSASDITAGNFFATDNAEVIKNYLVNAIEQKEKQKASNPQSTSSMLMKLQAALKAYEAGFEISEPVHQEKLEAKNNEATGPDNDVIMRDWITAAGVEYEEKNGKELSPSAIGFFQIMVSEATGKRLTGSLLNEFTPTALVEKLEQHIADNPDEDYEAEAVILKSFAASLPAKAP